MTLRHHGTRLCLPLVLLTVLLSAGRSSAGALDETPRSATLASGSSGAAGVVILVRGAEAEGRPTLELRREATHRILDTVSLPASVVVESAAMRVVADVEPRRHGGALLRVRLVTENEPEPSEPRWEGVFLAREGESPAAASWRLIWSARHSPLEVSERLFLGPPSRSGHQEIWVSLHHPRLQACGHDDLHLAPRRYDERRRAFVPTTLLPSTEGTPRLLSDPPHGNPHFPDATPLRHVSSSARSPLYPSYGPAPEGLGDGRPDTGWAAGGPGRGRGELIYADVLAPLSLSAVTLYAGIQGSAAAPTRVLLVGDGGRRFLLETTPETWQTFVLPEPWRTTCAAIVLLDGPAGQAPLGLGGLHLHTEADALPLSAALDDHLLPLLRATFQTLEHRRWARVIASAGPPALPYLLDRFLQDEGPAQAALVLAITSIDEGTARLVPLLAGRDFGSATLHELSRLGVLRASQSTAALVGQLLGASTQEEINQNLRLLSRTLDPLLAPLALPYLGRGDLRQRQYARRILERMRRDQSELLVAMLDVDDPAFRHDLLATLVVLGRRQSAGRDRAPASDAWNADTLRQLLAGDDVALARLALRLAGVWHITALADDLYRIADHDPHTRLRVDAMEALSAMSDAALDARLHDLLTRALADDEPNIRLTAARRIDERGWAVAFGPLLAARWEVERWPEVRRHLMRARLSLPAEDAGSLDANLLVSLPCQELDDTLRSWVQRGGVVDLDSAQRLLDRAAPACRGESQDSRGTACCAETRGGFPWVTKLFAVLARGQASALWAGQRSTEDHWEPRIRLAALEASCRADAQACLVYLDRMLASEQAQLRRGAVRTLLHCLDADIRSRIDRLAASESDPNVLRSIEAVRRAIRQQERVESVWEGLEGLWAP